MNCSKSDLRNLAMNYTLYKLLSCLETAGYRSKQQKRKRIFDSKLN